MAELIVKYATLYLISGVIFAVLFSFRGVERVDPEAKEGTWGFRLLILPGATVFWPLLAYRWLSQSGSPPTERNNHRNAAEKARLKGPLI